MTIRVAINGFGRIGRHIARLILSDHTSELNLVAINSVEDINSCAFLLKHDSVHGVFHPTVKVKGNQLIAGDLPPISFSNHATPENLPWAKHAVDVVIESSGKFTNGHLARGHITSGAQKVIITAAATEFSDVTICHGVNNKDYIHSLHNIISASSCTTNCIAPILKILCESIGITSAMATFLHSYTGGQPLIDSISKDLRRSRSAALNIIPTTTSAEDQLPIVLPETSGKFKAIAIRVPTPLTHIADLTVKLNKPLLKSELIELFSDASYKSMNGIISLSSEPLVSIDYKKSTYSSVIDINATKSYNNLVKMIIFHNNELSYSCRVINLLSFIGNYLNKS